ncbi:MAG: MASE3 domain-containing protein, partial [Gammaproteobacteria bacterium]
MPFRSIYPVKSGGLSWYKPIWVIGLSVLAFLVVWLFPFHPPGVAIPNYPAIHTAAEIFAVVISGIIFVTGWYGRNTLGVTRLVLCAVGFLGVALLDTAHTLSFKGMPDWVTPSGNGKGIYFWFAARYLAICSILILVLGSEWRKFRQGAEWWLLACVIGLAMITTWVVLLHQDWLPVFLVMGEGLTPAKITLEWLLIGLTALTLALVWRKREGITLYEPRCLVLALWLTGLSELCFTLYSDAADVFSLAGHIFKVVSYGFLYKSIIAGSVKLPYKLLAQTRAATQQLVDNIQEVFWMTSVDKQQVFFVSPAYETIWRRSCESLMESPLSWLDAVHPEDRERVERTLPLQASGGYSLEYRIIRPDGSERWIRDKAFPIYDENGEVLRVAGIADDITEQVSAAETLYKKERMLNQTQAIAHLGSWELDLENNHLTWSDEAYRIFGLTSQDVTASYEIFLASVHPEDRDLVDRYYKDSLERNDE